ncbi:hypothetical protein ACLKA6_006326 [Drosophila palustris]
MFSVASFELVAVTNFAELLGYQTPNSWLRGMPRLFVYTHTQPSVDANPSFIIRMQFVGKKAEFLAHYNTFCLGYLVEGEASGSKAGLSLRLRLRQLPPTPGGI